MSAGEKAVGTLGSTAQGRGLAMLRLDRTADALAADTAVLSETAQVGLRTAYDKGSVAGRSERLAAKLEPFDSYWQAPKDVEKGFTSFTAYYRANYLGHMPADKQARILVISCGQGYLVKMLRDCGYSAVLVVRD